MEEYKKKKKLDSKERYTYVPYKIGAACARFYEGLKHVKGATPFRTDCPSLYYIGSVMNGNYVDENSFLYSVVRSIVPTDEKEREAFYIKQIWNDHSVVGDTYVGTISPKKALNLVNTFLVKNLGCKEFSTTSITKSMASAFVECVEREYGDAVMLDFSELKWKNPVLCGYIKQEMEKRYSKIEGTDIYFNPDCKIERSLPLENQRKIKENYCDIVKKYVIHANNLIKKDTSYQTFREKSEEIEKCLNSMESKLDYRQKDDYAFSDCKKTLQNFMQNNEFVYCGSGRGDLAIALSDCLENIKKENELSETNIQTLKDFSKRILVLDKALDVKDADDMPYKGNFFACMPMRIDDFIDLGAKFAATEYANESIEQSTLSAIEKTLKIFGKDAERKNYQFDFVALKKYNGKAEKLSGEIIYDYRTQEQYSKFLADVQNSMDKNNLPKFDLCYEIVADAIAHGKKVVNLSGSNTSAPKSKKDKQ